MPFEIVRNDITHMQVDAIVNTANPAPVIGSGTDAAIHKKAGKQLLQARQCIGSIDTGHAAITPAYDLDAKYVIHTVGPIWIDGNHREAALLRSCYDHCLQLAQMHKCKSIAFPLISTGNYGFPKAQALQIAADAIQDFLAKQEMHIYLVVFDRDSFRLSEQLFQKVSSFIDEHYAAVHREETYGTRLENRARRQLFRQQRELGARSTPWEEWEEACAAPMEAPQPTQKATSLPELLKQADAGFSETLLKLIDASGKKDSDIYKKAFLSRQHFSKIRNNPQYKPTRSTAISLALALELNLKETMDLIGRAGYTLTNSSYFDLIIRYFIEEKNYNITEINMTLFEFDQPLLSP